MLFLPNTTIEHRKHIVTSDLGIIKSDVLTKIREIKFREIKPINFDKAKSSILTSLEEWIQKWCNKNWCKKKLFPEWTNNVTTKTDDRINVLNKNLRWYKTHDTLSSPTVRTALDRTYENFAVVPVDKTKNNVALICKCLYASVITNSDKRL